ncbi:hypothetical protein J2Z69_001788 [Paenibacillus shirakamiensis]|uniref:AlgX/AlgJ SGNH hydrolase-like domain-containing protein n=1 Tax=Paenibacillus shirakamiensis TaxID=1265935 RepID=A0ABS4JGC0_9BACL|nr:DHHW family protein [Paenibacillus shirakamiensis]MBP2000757.1 hypothetical protein [Paenibacillus shirakamiensis]
MKFTSLKITPQKMLVSGFLCAIFGMSGLFWVLPKTSFSETENRRLQQAPKFTWDHLISKQFSEDTEAYITDHFPWRTGWVQVKSEMEQARLQQENNGIYKGKDGYLFEKFNQPSDADLAQYTEAIGRFVQRHPESHMTLLLAPNSIGLYPERLPKFAPYGSEAYVNQFVGTKLGQRLTYLNGFDFLPKDSTQPLYYRTDHHWTTYGAFLAYQNYARHMQWTPESLIDYNVHTVSDAFLGSYQTRSQYGGLTPDTIQMYDPKSGRSSTQYVADTNQTIGLYDPSFLQRKDKYSYFLGGVHGLSVIHTQLPKNQTKIQKILVIKDSYAHSFLPFLTAHIPEIHVIDSRYYNGNISEYMTKNQITEVLFVFNTATFVDNPALLKL